MNTRNLNQEQISAFADGELDDSQVNDALGVLRSTHGRDAWAAYHKIGDILRSDDMAVNMSSDFAARVMRQLDDEPTVIAPRSNERVNSEEAQALALQSIGISKRRFDFQKLAAMAAVVMVTIIAVPQFMFDASEEADSVLSVATTTVPDMQQQQPVSSTVANTENDELLRDAGIDEYLLAHQRSSPTVYSAAQYARSATFAVETDK